MLEHASDGQFERWVNCFVDADVAEGASLGARLGTRQCDVEVEAGERAAQRRVTDDHSPVTRDPASMRSVWNVRAPCRCSR